MHDREPQALVAGFVNGLQGAAGRWSADWGRWRLGYLEGLTKRRELRRLLAGQFTANFLEAADHSAGIRPFSTTLANLGVNVHYGSVDAAAKQLFDSFSGKSAAARRADLSARFIYHSTHLLLITTAASRPDSSNRGLASGGRL
jgi:hypothetical protein